MIYQGTARHPVQGIIVHCTDTPADWRLDQPTSAKVAEVRRWHIEERGWKDIGYHWLIDRDGTIAPGRAETAIGAHVAGHNAGTIGISLFGGKGSGIHDGFYRHYTSAQDLALRKLIAAIRLCGGEPMWVNGHNQFDKGKACPGFWVTDWI